MSKRREVCPWLSLEGATGRNAEMRTYWELTKREGQPVAFLKCTVCWQTELVHWTLINGLSPFSSS